MNGAGSHLRPPALPLVAPGDVGKLGLIVAGAALALFVPSRHWLRVARFLASLTPASASSREDLARHVPQPMIRVIEAQGAPATSVFRANHLVECAQVIRHYLPWVWRPRVTLEGREHLDAALAMGKGAVLWVGDFASTNLVAKMALARYGYHLTHLSRLGHPHSDSRFGRAILNRAQVQAEARYLAGGHLMLDDRPGALRRGYDLLSGNTVVSVKAGTEATRVTEVPFLEGTLSISLGPPHLAATSGAPLLPVFCVESTPDDYEVTIGPPLPQSVGRDFRPAACAFAECLEPYVRKHPELWQGWNAVNPGPCAEPPAQPLPYRSS